MTQAVSSWGRLVRAEHELVPISTRATAADVVATARKPALPFGRGRSYGDECLNTGGVLWPMRGLDRFIAFDRESGMLECEAGVTLADILELVLPLGWFLPVTPGTQDVTVGGAIANDVHGKNHHRAGTFGCHVAGLELLRSDGSRLRCCPAENADWFAATVGGMGLTGVILSARVALRRVRGAWIDVESKPFESLDEFFAMSEAASARAEYTVSWIDCTAGKTAATRGIFFSGDHSSSDGPAPPRRGRSVPFSLPFSLVNDISVRAFNRRYYERQAARRGTSRQHCIPFFYPLDQLLEWNRIYGSRGFYQYQCVVPRVVEREATSELLRLIAASGSGSFLAVLKTFGDHPSPGMLSFPMVGTTLALDFPNRGATTVSLFESLNAVVGDAGGRIYPAKDSVMPARLFRRGYPRWQAFAQFRDPAIASDMSRRLFAADA